MAATLDHVIVPATDKHVSAGFIARILDAAAEPVWGPFVPVPLANGVTLAFMDATGFSEHHCAFLVSEVDFDAVIERIRASGAGFYADPFRRRPGEINHGYGGRGVYFDDPDHHLMEVITQPYGPEPEE